MLREIGSDFWSNNEHDGIMKSYFHIEGIGECRWKQFYISGRSAIRAFARNVEVSTKKVLIPAFSCETVIVPFQREGWEIAYYGICTNLKPDKQNLAECIEKFSPSVVVMQSYFGFDTIAGFEDVVTLCKEKNIIVLEDLTQCLFSDFKKTEAHYYVSSFRKFIAIPEGGILLSRGDSIGGEIKKPVPDIVKAAEEAFELKKKYMDGDVGISKEVFLGKYREFKNLISAYSDVYEMNASSREILNHIDSQELKKQRRDNYGLLYRELKSVSWMTCIFETPEQTETPLYFPIYINCADRRKEVQAYLSSERVYCSIVWPRYMERGEIDDDSNYIYDHILCIPCDQRYGIEEMQRIIQVIEKIENR